MCTEIPMVDVAGIGINAVDTIIELPRFPSPDEKMKIASARVHAGGQVASAIVACATWGLKTRYAGKVGDDAFGELKRRGFALAGCKAHLIVVGDWASQSFNVQAIYQTEA